MKIWLLTNTILDEITATLVEANSEDQARRWAYTNALNEKARHPDVWLEGQYTTCVEIKLTGKSHILATVVDQDYGR